MNNSFSKIEKDSGFNFFYKLVMANASEAFQLSLKDGGEVMVRFDMVFDDDSSSQADTSLIEMEYRTISFEIIKVLKNDPSLHYKEGDFILVNPLEMPSSYKIVK